jgi:hypothetical protein
LKLPAAPVRLVRKDDVRAFRVEVRERGIVVLARARGEFDVVHVVTASDMQRHRVVQALNVLGAGFENVISELEVGADIVCYVDKVLLSLQIAKNIVVVGHAIKEVVVEMVVPFLNGGLKEEPDVLKALKFECFEELMMPRPVAEGAARNAELETSMCRDTA